MAQLHATAVSLKASFPTSEHAAFDNAFGSLSQSEQAQAGGLLQNLIALLKSMGLSINFGCLLSILPQVIAAFSNPALWLAVLQAYFALRESNADAVKISGTLWTVPIL